MGEVIDSFRGTKVTHTEDVGACTLLIPWGRRADAPGLSWRGVMDDPSALAETVKGLDFPWLYDLPDARGNEIALGDFAWPMLLDAPLRATGEIHDPRRTMDLDENGVLRRQSGALTKWAEAQETDEPKLLADLYKSMLDIPRVGAAVTTKLLHKKAPDRLPILDRWAILAYGGDDQAAAAEMPGQLVVLTQMVRETVGRHSLALEEIRRRLPRERPYSSLSDLRLYDIICWVLWNATDRALREILRSNETPASELRFDRCPGTVRGDWTTWLGPAATDEVIAWRMCDD